MYPSPLHPRLTALFSSILILAGLSLTACHSSPREEQKFLGTWQADDATVQALKAQGAAPVDSFAYDFETNGSGCIRLVYPLSSPFSGQQIQHIPLIWSYKNGDIYVTHQPKNISIQLRNFQLDTLAWQQLSPQERNFLLPSGTHYIYPSPKELVNNLTLQLRQHLSESLEGEQALGIQSIKGETIQILDQLLGSITLHHLPTQEHTH